MTTAPPPTRAIQAPGNRPGGASPAGGAAATIDPIKLLKQYYPYLLVALMFGTAIGVGLHFLLLKVSPRYTSIVLVECMGSRENAQEIRREPGRDEQERFLGTQVQLMLSRNILESALGERDVLKTEWAQPYLGANNSIDKHRAIRAIEKSLTARPIPQSNFIQLRMSTGVAEDAATIVNAVANAYILDHRRTNSGGTSDQRKVMGDQVRKLEDDLKRLKTDREQVLKEAELDSVNNSGPDMELADLTIKVNELVASLQAVRAQQQSFAERLRRSGVEHYPDDVREEAAQDHVVRGYDQKLASLRDNLGAMRKQGYGENHADMKTLKAQIAEAETQRQQQLEAKLRELSAARMAQIDNSLVSLEAQYSEAMERKDKLDLRRQEILQAQVRVRTLDDEIEVVTNNLNNQQVAMRQIGMLADRTSEATEAIGDRVRIMSAGVIPKGVSFPRIEIVVPLTAFFFTGLVGGVLFLREILDQRVRGPSDAAMVPRVKVIGVVPDAAEDPSRPTAIETVFRDNPTGVLTESYRQMRAPLIQAMERSGHKSLVVLGAMPGSGATSVASNVALAVAGADERVLIVDANFRRPGMHRIFKLSEGPGLGDILAGSTTLDQAIQPTSNDNLKVITAGTPSSRAIPERLAGEAMSRFLLEASTRFDMIIVDVPPAVVSGDGYAVANKCDASIVVCRAMVEKRGLLARVRNQIGESRAEFLGVVVNAVRASAGGYFKKNIKATHAYQSNGKA